MLLVLSLARAGEVTPDAPGPGFGDLDPVLPSLDVSVAVPWTDIGFAPAAPEAAAFGPDHLAIGPDGRWAVWDPVERRVRGADLDLDVPRADALAFTDDGDLLVLDAAARTVARYGAGVRRAEREIDRLCPAGVALVVDGDAVYGADVFGNLHRLARLDGDGLAAATGARLRPAPHTLRAAGGAVQADGVALPLPADTLGGRVVGDWVVVEIGARGAVRARQAVSLATDRVVDLPTRAGAPYRPADDVAVDADGDLAWLDPRADALYVRRVSP